MRSPPTFLLNPLPCPHPVLVCSRLFFSSRPGAASRSYIPPFLSLSLLSSFTLPAQTQFDLRLLLGGGGLGLRGSLPIAPDHDDAEEGADDGAANQDQDHGDADGPDARGEEGVQRVVGVDEGLFFGGGGLLGPWSVSLASLVVWAQGVGREDGKGGCEKGWDGTGLTITIVHSE